MGDQINFPVAFSPTTEFNKSNEQFNLPASGNALGMPFSTNLKDIAEAYFAVREGGQNLRHHGQLHRLELMSKVMRTRSELTEHRLRLASLPQNSPHVAQEAAYLDMIELGLAEEIRALGLPITGIDKYA